MLRKYIMQLKNNKNLFLNILGTVGIKGLSMIINLLTLSAYMYYFLDQQILGVWFVLVAILNWILTFDLGVGNGLRNNLVEAFVENDSTKIKKFISSAYFVLGMISITLILVGNLIIGFINWNSILNISNTIIDISFLITIVRIMFSGIILQFFLKLIVSILYAMQKTALSNLLSLISNSCIFLFVILSNVYDVKSSLMNLSIFYVIAMNLPLLLVTILVFKGPLSKSSPNIKFWSKKDTNKVMKLGYMFFWIQVTLLTINLTNEFIITKLFGPKYVVEYQVYNRFYMIFLTFVSILTTPIWSAVTKAYNESKIKWISKMYKYLSCIALVVSGICLLIIPIFQIIVDLWLGHNSFDVNLSTTLLFAIFTSVMIYIYAVTSITNGIGDLKPQMICNTLAALFKIPLVLLLSKVINNWSVVVLVNVVIMLPNAVLQTIAIRKRLHFISIDNSTVRR